MEFSFIDRILYFEPKQKAVAIKHINADDYHYLYQDNDNPYLFPSLLAEAVGQLNAWIVMQHNQYTLRPVAILYDQMEFLAKAKLGDTLIIETELKAIDEKTSLFDGRVKVGDTIIFKEQNAAGAFLPMQDFIDPERVKNEFKQLMREGEIPNHINNEVLSKNIPNQIVDVYYDSISEINENSIKAYKHINLMAPYFSEHFPNKPVLPICILLECTINLAKYFIKNNMKKNKAFKIYKIQNVKIADFMLPGSTLVTELTLKNHSENEIVIRSKTSIENKRVCMAELVFKNCLHTHI